MTSSTLRRIAWRLLALVALVATAVLAATSPSTADVGETRLDHARASDAGTISVGLSHTCAVLSDGTLWCWGNNDSGQLGLGNTTNQSSPARVGSASNWRTVSAGSGKTTCAVNTSNELFCWGFNFSGQVGVSSATNPVTSPTKVTALGTSVQSVSVGGTSVCAVTTTGGVMCWGSNSEGKVGKAIAVGSSTHTPVAVTNLSGVFTSVAVGDYGACALRNDKNAYCWGSDLWGQRGDDTAMTATDANPTLVAAGEAVSGLMAGPASNCLIIERNGAVRCWGQNESNYLSTTNGNLTTPVIASAAPFSGNAGRGFSIGSNFACMLTNANGSVKCGGVDSITGVGATGRVTNAPSGSGHLAMTVGNVHGCAIRSDRRLVCWGLNSYGQIGTGSTGTATPATVVSFGTHATQTMGAEPVGPSAPGSVTAAPAFRGLTVSWTAPSSSGTSAITDYQYRLSTDGGSTWGSWVSFGSTSLISLSGRISGLTAGTAYLVQVRAVSADGNGGETAAAAPVIASAGCDPMNNCALGSIGPNGGIIVADAGPGVRFGRFIEAAPTGWRNGTTADPSSDWTTAISTASNYRPITNGPWGTLPSSADLVKISQNYTANPSLLADWPLADPNAYWSSDVDYDDPNNNSAFAGTVSQSKDSWFSYRPVHYLDGPAQLPAPVVTATASELAISVSWTAPSTANSGAITSYETRLSTNGGSTWSAWTSQGLATTLSLTGLTSGTSYRVQARAVNFAGPGLEGQSAVVTMTPSLAPSSQTVNGTVNTEISATTAFNTTNFSGAVTYAVTSGVLPTGLSIDANSGVISGTPSAVADFSVTITATGASGGSATASVSFSIAPEPPPAPGQVGGVWAIDGLDAVVLEWFAPTTGEPATGYEYATSIDGGQTFSAFSAVPMIVTTSAGSSTLVSTRISTGLTRGVETIFQVRAMNGSTPGPVFPDPSHFTWPTWSPRATAKLDDPCDPMNDCELGSVGPGGGIIVYDHGFNASWGRYLESAPAYWSGASGDPVAKFGCVGTKIEAVVGAAHQAIGSGAANTTVIMASCGEAGIAARVADAHSTAVNGNLVDDWHLPSSGELSAMHSFRQTLGGWKYSVITGDSRHYASSTDFGNDYFYGIGGTHDKFFSSYVRPVRYVSGPEAPSEPGLIAAAGNSVVDLIWSAPTNDGGSSVTDYQLRMSTDGGQTWEAWTSVGTATSYTKSGLTVGVDHVFEVRAINRGGISEAVSTGVVVPGVQSLTWVVGESLNSSTIFRGSSSVSGATFTVTAGSLPDGLSLNATTGVIDGEPTTEGSATVTFTASIGIVSVSATIEITIDPRPPSSNPPSNPNPGPSDPVPNPNPGPSAPPPDAAPPDSEDGLENSPGSGSGVGESDTPSRLITPERQAELTAPGGEAKMLADGVLVDVDLTQASPELRATTPAERTVTQISELRDLAASMIDQVRTVLGEGGIVPLSVRQTATGAVIIGLVTDPVTGSPIEVPVEHVVLIRGGGLLLMVAGSDGSEPARVSADGVLEIAAGGVVSVLAYGLMPGVSGEVVVMSTPRLISQFEVSEDGGASAQATLPSDLAVGEHTVVVTVGEEAASLGFRIVDDAFDFTLPVTGHDSDRVINWSLALLVAGVLLIVMKRRRLRLGV